MLLILVNGRTLMMLRLLLKLLLLFEKNTPRTAKKFPYIYYSKFNILQLYSLNVLVWKYYVTYYKSKRFNISTSRFVEKYCPAAKLFEFIAKTTALNRISRKWHTTHLGLQSESVGLPASNIIIRIVDAAASQKHNRLYNFTLDLQDYLKTLFKC